MSGDRNGALHLGECVSLGNVLLYVYVYVYTSPDRVYVQADEFFNNRTRTQVKKLGHTIIASLRLFRFIPRSSIEQIA